MGVILEIACCIERDCRPEEGILKPREEPISDQVEGFLNRPDYQRIEQWRQWPMVKRSSPN